ncbi:LacI family transcriptional regulator [Rhizobium aethiopicum]|uniref:LacI family transcriptional regulator n=1 Tax=Rhizobium aethiopicum TaxID=1138170 RepID=A0A7W6QDD3_9HYPH|nr:LacI family DNA-binding transcriptional regulator [Rhizobium aethiopicum]MBB4195457.1 LacI family transcriptional regulator [Rhizobium aethiopicum]MBB4583097.1 LacI family transcriptional regulator [Rhizobium aethiopicum]
MKKATITDIARKSGLSTATVDRALNDRGGVSAANRQRVLRAAKELGYLPSEGMLALPSRPAHLEFFIPFGHNSFMQDVARKITAFASSLPLVASCNVTALDGIDPDALVTALEDLPLQTNGVGIITVDHPKTRHAIRRLCESGVRVVTIVTDVLSTPRSAFVGVDNLVAGRTAALIMGLMSRRATGSIGLFLGSRTLHGHQQREYGFRTLLEEQFKHLTILPAIETRDENKLSRPAMERILRDTADLVGIYCVGAGRAGIAEVLQAATGTRRPFVIMHDLTDATRTWLAEDLIDVVIDQNARLIGEQVVIRLLGSIAASTPTLSLKNIEPRIIFRENIPLV